MHGMTARKRTVVCQGRWPILACDAVLTARERRWFGAACEECYRAFEDRFRAWQGGAQDALFDEAYGRPATRSRK